METITPQLAQGESIDDGLRRLLIAGTIKQGTWLREEVLARKFGISRTPLREAFQRLAKEGLLDRIPRRGFRATGFDLKELEELYAVLVTLEIQGLQSIVEPIETLVSDLKALNFGESSHSLAASHSYETDIQWHARPISACGNSVLIGLHHELATRLARYFHVFWASEGGANRSQDEHASIERAISANDIDLACAQLKSHRRMGLNRIRTRLESEESFDIHL